MLYPSKTGVQKGKKTFCIIDVLQIPILYNKNKFILQECEQKYPKNKNLIQAKLYHQLSEKGRKEMLNINPV